MRSLINGVLSLALFASSSAAFADDRGSEVVTSQHSFSLTKIAGNLENPWGLDWLPSGQIIVTERPGSYPDLNRWPHQNTCSRFTENYE